MSGAEKSNPPAGQRAAFFRQSGWLMIATVLGGGLMWAVHFLAKRVPASEYGLFGVMLAVAACVPILPLQMVFAQQTAKARVLGRERDVAGMLRWATLATLLLAGLLALIVFIWQAPMESALKMSHPTVLWIMVGVIFFSVWLPILSGVMQGLQNFLWLGWVAIINALGRFTGAAGLVLIAGWWSAGMVTGIGLGVAAGVGLCLWQTRSIWRLPAQAFDTRAVLGHIIPLLLGFGAVQFLFTADTIFVKVFFTSDETGFYVGAGTLSRALLWLVLPMATVMFPKIVQSAARSEKNNLVWVVMAGTVILAACGAIGLTVLRSWVIRFVFEEEYVKVGAAVLPWYAWAMVPLSLAIVLANNLLARGQFRVVPVLVVLAIAYGFTLGHCHSSLISVLQILGGYNLLLLAVCGWFTWRSQPGKPS